MKIGHTVFVLCRVQYHRVRSTRPSTLSYAVISTTVPVSHVRYVRVAIGLH